MNEIEKLRNTYNNPHNLQEKQRTEEIINNHIKLIETQVVAMKSTIDNTTRNMKQLWEQRTALHNILHKQEKVTRAAEKPITIPQQINMLKQPIDTRSVTQEITYEQARPVQCQKITDANISVHASHVETLECSVIPIPEHTFLIVELDLPHKWLYDYKIIQLSKQIKNNKCIVQIDLDSVPQQHKHITEVSGVKNGYIDIYVNNGTNKVYNIRIISITNFVALDSMSTNGTSESDMRSIVLSCLQTDDQSRVLLIGRLCGIRTCF